MSEKAIIVAGKHYILEEKAVSVMKYVEEALELEKGHMVTITNISTDTFELILRIIRESNYKIMEPPKIKNCIVQDHIGVLLNHQLGKMDSKELNELYRAVHYLKIYPLRRCIAAVMACRVYIEPNLPAYQKRKRQLKERELTPEKIKEYKDRFPFIN